MAANFRDAAPQEPEKQGNYLHDRERIPAQKWARAEIVRSYGGFALGMLFALGLVALAFAARDSWGERRDWVVPGAVPILAVAGIALGHLIWRQQWAASFPAFLLLLALGGLVASNIWRGQLVQGPDRGRDVLAISSGIVLALLSLYLVVALVWVEVKRPTRPPAATF